MSTKQHVIIVGAGILGASLAFALSQRGQGVTILEKTAPASAASGKSFAWLNANYPDTPEYFELRIAALAHYRALAQSHDMSGLIQFGGSIWWEDEGEDFDKHVALLESFDYDCEVIDAARIKALAPALVEPPERALYAPAEAGVSLVGLTQWMLAEATQQGATLHVGTDVQAPIMGGGRVTGVLTNLGEITGDHVVFAAGTGSADLVGALGYHLPMNNADGLILRSHPMPSMIDQVIMSPDVHFRQDPDGTLLMGEIFSGAFDKGQDIPALAADVVNRVRAKLIDGQDLQLAQIQVGTRPVPVDGFPVVGGVPGAPGASLAVMHSGATLGPLIGSLLCDELLGEAPSPLLAAFRPERFKKG